MLKHCWAVWMARACSNPSWQREACMNLSKDGLAYLLVAGGSLLFTLPLWWVFSPTFNSGDFSFYLLSLREFSSQLWQGEWYPRWIHEANMGFGAPIFLYYSPLAYYITSLFQPFASADPLGIGRYIAGGTLAVLLTNLSFYALARQWLMRRAAFIAALMFCVFPYRILTLYVQTGMATQWALCFSVLALLCVSKMAKGQRALVPAALCIAGVMLSHLPSFVVLAVVLPVFTMAAYGDAWKRGLVKVGMAGLWGMALSAFYWLPMLQALELVQRDNFLLDQFHYRNNFWYSVFDAFMSPWWVVLLAGMYYRKTLRQFMERLAGEERGRVSVLIAPLLLLFFISTPAAMPLWDLLYPLQILQFPFRFYPVAIVFVCMIAALLISAHRMQRYIVPVFAAMLISQSWFVAHFVPYDDSGVVKEIHEGNWVWPREYRTRWQPPAPVDTVKVNMPQMAELPLHMKLADIAEGEGEVEATRKGGNYYVKADITSDEALIRLHRYYFAGMRAAEDAPDGKTLQLGPDEGGLATMKLPQGKSEARIELAPYDGDEQGRTASAIAALVALISLVVRKRRTPQQS
jgi:hypothetical protein